MGFVTGNGNVIQIEILSFNVINPQVAVNGSNTAHIGTQGNQAYDNGVGSSTVAAGSIPPGFGIPGLFYIFTTKTGNGNVTHIAILSHNVFAPQVAIPGPREGSGTNTSVIDTVVNDAVNNGSDSDTEADLDDPVKGAQVGNGNVEQGATGRGRSATRRSAETSTWRSSPSRNPSPSQNRNPSRSRNRSQSHSRVRQQRQQCPNVTERGTGKPLDDEPRSRSRSRPSRRPRRRRTTTTPRSTNRT